MGDRAPRKQAWPSFALTEDRQGKMRAEGSWGGRRERKGLQETLRIRLVGWQVAGVSLLLVSAGRLGDVVLGVYGHRGVCCSQGIMAWLGLH